MNETQNTQQHPKVEIAVENFGPIAEADIDLRPLTVFVGPSNTGKTYLATLVYALHSTFGGFSGLGILYLSALGLLSEIMSDLRDKTSTDPSLLKEDVQNFLKKLGIQERAFKSSDLPKVMRKEWVAIIENSEIFGDELQGELLRQLKNCFDLNSELTLIRSTIEGCNEMTVSLKVSNGNQGCWNLKMRVSESGITLDRAANEDIILLPQGGAINTNTLGLDFTLERKWKTRSPYYLPASRSGIIQSHRIIASSLMERATRSDSSGIPTLSSVIVDFMKHLPLYEESKESNDTILAIADVLESEVLVGKITAKPLLSGYPEFFYQPHGAKEEIRLNQSSSMVSELAPLVLFLRGLVRPGDTLIIEEPEAHLHPGAQADMAVILARLVRAGVRVIITTHSDWLLQEISNLTLEGLLEEETDEPTSWLLPEEVGVWHFQKDEPVKEIPFKPREGLSPEDYEDVAEGLYNRSVNLQQRFEKKKGESGRESA